ncbi:secretion protein [Flavobacteriaceae bacterium CRH]|nr:secretion protein [Flavobacteriaceae bacterium CRH]
MKKNYITLLFVFVCTIMFGQKVTLTPTVVNGASFSAGPINLAGVPNSTISLGIKVEVPANVAVGDNGTIKIFFSKGSGLGGNVAAGGDGGTLYFGGGKTATKSFVINLNWTDFLTAGGFIYAEYKSGVSYNSSNVAVVKNATMTGGTTLNPPADAPNPSDIANTLCCNQTIRQGDKPAPITGSQYLNPYKGEPYGVNSQWLVTSGPYNSLDDVNKTMNIDYITELKNITVTRKLGYSYGGQFPNKSNDVTITIVPSPITSNEISVDASVDTNGFAEIIDTNPKEILGSDSYVNLNILADPFYIPRRSETSLNVDKYEWEYTKTNKNLGGFYNWTVIPNENSTSLSSNKFADISNSEDNYFLIRRIATYQNIKRASNSLKVVIRTIRNNNTICCNQDLLISSTNEIEKPSMISGSTAVLASGHLLYQWQIQSITSRGKISSNWSNIQGATSKDYLPLPLEIIPATGPRDRATTQNYNYRRIASSNIFTGETSYSNEISLTSSFSQSPPQASSIIIYPNPATSIINIENKDTSFLTPTISIVNILGIEVNSNNFSIMNPNLLNVDISNLIPGTYFLNLKTRNTYLQFTFVKN